MLKTFLKYFFNIVVFFDNSKTHPLPVSRTIRIAREGYYSIFFSSKISKTKSFEVYYKRFCTERGVVLWFYNNLFILFTFFYKHFFYQKTYRSNLQIYTFL